jgi:MoaA/NifB/PqqE/SkfB family radical SAM enzyme
MTAADITDLIKEIHTINPKFDRISLTGGEPMTEKEKVLQISQFARSLGIRVRLVTRGWELDPATCRELLVAGVSRVQIGLDSSGDITFQDEQGRKWDTLHSWLRDDEDGFRHSLEGIANALQAKLEVSVRYSLCRSNLFDVIPTYHRISDMGVSKFKFRVLFPNGRAMDDLMKELVSGGDLARAQHSLIKASAGNHTLVEITQPCYFTLPGRATVVNKEGPKAYKEPCPCGRDAAYVDSNGDVKYCLFDVESIGNIFETGFLSVWNSVRAGAVRKQRCPLDMSGRDCSSFALLYSQCGSYDAFIKEYAGAMVVIEHSGD